MKKRFALFIFLGVFLFSSFSLFAADDPDGGILSKFGLIFEVENLTAPVNPYSDGVLSGGGVKFRLTTTMALRALIYINVLNNSDTDVSTNYFGVAAAFEYHFISGKVSPYAGALGGFSSETIVDTLNEFYLGAIAGVEFTIVQSISIFAEYGLYFMFRDAEMEIDLGRNYGPAIGLIFYFG